MTREEEIEQQALLDEDAYVENNYYAFKRGVEWADKHPKRYNQDELCDVQLEMMKQRDKRLIAKACEWLDINFPNIDNVGFWYKEGFIKQFKKAMGNNYETIDNKD